MLDNASRYTVEYKVERLDIISSECSFYNRSSIMHQHSHVQCWSIQQDMQFAKRCGSPRNLWLLKNNFGWQAAVSVVSEITTTIMHRKAGADHAPCGVRGACKTVAATTMGNYLKRATSWGTGQLGRVLDARIRAMVHWRSKLELPLGAEQSTQDEGEGEDEGAWWRREWKWEWARWCWWWRLCNSQNDWN